MLSFLGVFIGAILLLIWWQRFLWSRLQKSTQQKTKPESYHLRLSVNNQSLCVVAFDDQKRLFLLKRNNRTQIKICSSRLYFYDNRVIEMQASQTQLGGDWDNLMTTHILNGRTHVELLGRGMLGSIQVIWKNLSSRVRRSCTNQAGFLHLLYEEIAWRRVLSAQSNWLKLVKVWKWPNMAIYTFFGHDIQPEGEEWKTGIELSW